MQLIIWQKIDSLTCSSCTEATNCSDHFMFFCQNYMNIVQISFCFALSPHSRNFTFAKVFSSTVSFLQVSHSKLDARTEIAQQDSISRLVWKWPLSLWLKSVKFSISDCSPCVRTCGERPNDLRNTRRKTDFMYLILRLNPKYHCNMSESGHQSGPISKVWMKESVFLFGKLFSKVPLIS